MKKLLFLLGLTTLILLSSCTKSKVTCTITSPKDKAEVSINDDLVVTVEAKDTKGIIATVIVYFNNLSYLATGTNPYTATIPATVLTLEKYTIKAIATNTEGGQGEASITVNITNSSGGTDDESPNFVTFANGKIPPSWKTSTWSVDVAMGWDDNYSLRSQDHPASVVTDKTMNGSSYVEFYTRGTNFDLYINNAKQSALSSVPAGNNWSKWIYAFEKGRNSFRWETTLGAAVYLDAITFAAATLPKVTTNANVNKITATSAISGGNVTDNGNHWIIARGVCWSTSENPTIDDNKTTDGSGTGSFTSNITGLDEGTTYYVKAYATNGVGTIYGEQRSFTARENDESVEINGVFWATRNVDMPGTFAANWEDAGMFYQWNRKIGWSSTNPMVNSNGGTTWNNSIPTGTTWEKANDPCPTGWRVPTKEELESLVNAGSQWTTIYGVKGRIFGSGVASLFLPAAGSRYSYDGTLGNVGSNGYYWSSSPRPDFSKGAYNVHFSEGNANMGGYTRSFGHSVRCVAE